MTDKHEGVIVAFQERLVSADVILRYIRSRARLTKPMADLACKIETDLDWLIDKMEQEDLERNVQMEDAWGSPSDVYYPLLSGSDNRNIRLIHESLRKKVEDAWGSPSDVKLVPNYRSLESMPEFIKEEGF